MILELKTGRIDRLKHVFEVKNANFAIESRSMPPSLSYFSNIQALEINCNAI